MENVEKIIVDKGQRINEKTGDPINSPTRSGDVLLKSSNGKNITYSEVLGRMFKSNTVNFAEYPGPYDVHINTALTDLSVSYEIDSGLFIAPVVAPVLTVSKRTNSFFKIARGDVARDYENLVQRAVGAVANDAAQGFTTDTYTTSLRALRLFNADKVIDNADQALQLLQNNTEFLTSALDKSWDKFAIAQLLSASATATFSSLTNGGTGTVATATPTNPYISQALNAAKTAFRLANNGKFPNTIIMNAAIAQNLSISQELQAQTIYDLGQKFVEMPAWSGQRSKLPEYLNGMKVVVASIPTNSGPIGQPDSFSDMLNNSLILALVEQPQLKTQNFVTTFRVGGIEVRTYRDEARRGSYVEVEMDQAEQITNDFGGYVITGL